MQLVLEATVGNSTFVGFTANDATAEGLIIERFLSVASIDDDLVMTSVGDVNIYCIRTPVEVTEAEEEGYADEPNALDFDGGTDGNLDSSLSSDDFLDEGPAFEFGEEFLWSVHTGDPDVDLGINQEALFLNSLGVDSPFELSENLAVITTKRN